MPKKKTNGPLYGILFIIVFLGALAVVPPLLKSRSHKVPTDLSGKPLGKVDLEQRFDLIYRTPGNRVRVRKIRTTTLKALFQNRKTLLINFWATWCPPCLEELPSLEYLHRQLNAKDDQRYPRLVTLSVDEGLKEIQTLFESLSFRPSFPVLHDADSSFAAGLGTVKFPETYWVDQDGVILHQWIGPQDWLSEEVLRKFRVGS